MTIDCLLNHHHHGERAPFANSNANNYDFEDNTDHRDDRLNSTYIAQHLHRRLAIWEDCRFAFKYKFVIRARLKIFLLHGGKGQLMR